MSANAPEVDRPGPPTRTSVEVETIPLLVVIVNYKTAALTVTCLETLKPELEAIPGARVTVVENASGDGEVLAHAIAERGWGGWVSLEVVERNGGFAMGNNQAIRPALTWDHPPRYVLLLNADTEVYPGAIQTLVDFMDREPKVGIAGSTFQNLDGSDWHIAFRFYTPLGEFERGIQFGLVSKLMKDRVVNRFMDQGRAQEVDWVAGACMIVRREVFESAGLMDEKYFLYFEEVDFCLQAKRKGWPCWYVPQSKIMHIGGQSTGVTERNLRPPRTPPYYFASRRRFFLKNYGLAGAMVADLGFGIGYSLWRLSRFVLRKPELEPPHFLLDFWKNSVFLRRD